MYRKWKSEENCKNVGLVEGDDGEDTAPADPSASQP